MIRGGVGLAARDEASRMPRHNAASAVPCPALVRAWSAVNRRLRPAVVALQCRAAAPARDVPVGPRNCRNVFSNTR
jgi:hypothetical protein